MNHSLYQKSRIKSIIINLTFLTLVLINGCGFYETQHEPTQSNNKLLDHSIQVPTKASTPIRLEPTISPTQLPQPTPSTPEVKKTRSPNNPSTTPTILVLEPRPTIIGYSVSGRPIEVFRFGYGTSERMIIAGVHGGYEWNTIALADELIKYLSDHPEVIPIKKRLFILRSLNPDGEARSLGYEGRANDNGVDINRNFPAFWQVKWNPQGCWDWLPITAGPHAASEPETQALMAFINRHRIMASLSYHSAALGIFPGGRPPDPKSVSLAEAIAKVSTYPYPPISGGCEFTGQMADWLSEQGIAAIDIELTNHTDKDFNQTLEIIDVLLNWEP